MKRPMYKYKLKYKIWLDKDGKVFGEGPYELLQGIKETGSLNSAAKKMGMSYSQAHKLIKNLEKKLGFPLVFSQAGGSRGGGSQLTPEAQVLMKKFAGFREECARILPIIFAKYFGEDDM